MPNLVIIILLAGMFLMFFLNHRKGRWPFREMRRRQLRRGVFPESWIGIMKENVPLYNFLADDLKKELQGHVQVFLAEKNFEGCNGLELTDEIKVTIAAQACMLLLNKKPHYYPMCDSILVYPSTFITDHFSKMGNVYVGGKTSVLGTSWSRGSVTLAWDDVKHSAHDYKDGHNLVLHEFAHQLDAEDGVTDGRPILHQRSNYLTWARVLGKAYEKLQRNVSKGRKTVIDDYGATNPAEFFAVITETFFEKPKQLKKKYPDLYKELSDYYKLDPVRWSPE